MSAVHKITDLGTGIRGFNCWLILVLQILNIIIIIIVNLRVYRMVSKTGLKDLIIEDKNMSKFVPGVSGNPKGRPKGTFKQRYDLSVRAWLKAKNKNILDMVDNALKHQADAIKEIEDPIERAKALNEMTKRLQELMPYVTPKIKDSEFKEVLEDESKVIDLEEEVLDPKAVIEASSTDTIIRVLQESMKKS